MTMWTIIDGNILDVAADVLVCSANPFLTLSGGVGGAFSLRYGPAMQGQLIEHLMKLGVRHVPTGTVVEMAPCDSAYQLVMHAVAVDAEYKSTPQIITRIVERILYRVGELESKSVALPALATGYGMLTKEEFAQGLLPLLDRNFNVESVIICLKRPDDAELVRKILGLEIP